jgi:hypothetical protein
MLATKRAGAVAVSVRNESRHQASDARVHLKQPHAAPAGAGNDSWAHTNLHFASSTAEHERLAARVEHEA